MVNILSSSFNNWSDDVSSDLKRRLYFFLNIRQPADEVETTPKLNANPTTNTNTNTNANANANAKLGDCRLALCSMLR